MERKRLDGEAVRQSEGIPISALDKEFALFRRPREPRDELPPKLAREVEAALGLDVTTSRLARTFEGEQVYLVPSREITCMVSRHDAVGACWGTQGARSADATSTALCGPGLPRGRIATFGLAPDGVEEVTIIRSNVPDRTVPVIGNVYVAMTSSAPPLPVHLSWVRDGARVVRKTGIPPNFAPAGCEAGESPSHPKR